MNNDHPVPPYRAEGLIDAALADLLEDKGEAFKTDHTLPQFVPHRLVRGALYLGRGGHRYACVVSLSEDFLILSSLLSFCSLSSAYILYMKRPR